MQISVVIPSFNRRPTLARALDSVFAQTSPADEVIVVDDGSSDGSAELVRSNYPQVTLIRQRNQGVSAARNRGIDAAAGDWIALLDSDDSWRDDKIERIRAAQRQNPDQILFHSDEIWIRDGRRVNPMRKHRKYGGRIFRHCLPLCVISPSAAVIEKSTLRDLGAFDSRLPACEDYDLWLRLCHRFPVFYLDLPLITKYGGHADQLSRRFEFMDRFRVVALHRLLREAELGDEDFTAARSVLLQKLDILLNGASKHGNHALIDEFEPIRQAWLTAAARAASC